MPSSPTSPGPLISAELIFPVSPFKTLTFPPPPLIPIRYLGGADHRESFLGSTSPAAVNLSNSNAVLRDITGYYDLRGVNLASVSFQNCDLSNTMFEQNVFSAHNPNTGLMEGVDFSGTNAVLANLTGAVNFSGVNLSSVSFMNADLTGATFDSTTVFGGFNANTGLVEGVNFSGTNAVLSNLTGAINFSGANLSSVSFQNSDLSTATFDTNTVLGGADFSGVISGVNLAGTNAVLRDITGYYDLRGVNLASVSFQNCDLSNTMFEQNVFSAHNPNTGLMERVDFSGTMRCWLT